MKTLVAITLSALLIASTASVALGTEEHSRKLVVPILGLVYGITPEATEAAVDKAVENLSTEGLGPECKIMADEILLTVLALDGMADRGLKVGPEAIEWIFPTTDVVKACRYSEE